MLYVGTRKIAGSESQNDGSNTRKHQVMSQMKWWLTRTLIIEKRMGVLKTVFLIAFYYGKPMNGKSPNITIVDLSKAP